MDEHPTNFGNPMNNMAGVAAESAPTQPVASRQDPSVAEPRYAGNDTAHTGEHAGKQSAEPTLCTADINDIMANKPSAGAAHLHPNFVAARKKTQFKPRQSGNPGGRRRSRMAETLAEQLSTVHEGDPLHRTYEELVARALVLKGVGGDVAAIRVTFDRRDGKVGPGAAVASQTDRLAEVVRAIQGDPEALHAVLGTISDQLSWLTRVSCHNRSSCARWGRFGRHPTAKPLRISCRTPFFF